MVGGFVPITTVKAADYDVKLGDNAYGTFSNGTLYIEGNGKLYDGKRIKATPRDSTENLLNVAAQLQKRGIPELAASSRRNVVTVGNKKTSVFEFVR